MKDTLAAAIEELQWFQESLSETDFLVDLATQATREQRAALVNWVYTQYAPPELSLDPDSMKVEVTPYIESEFTGDEKPVYAVELSALEREAGIGGTGLGYECLAVTLDDVKSSKP